MGVDDATTDDGTLENRRVNRKNRVLSWDVGTMAPGEVATAVLEVEGTTKRKARCGDVVELTAGWSATATAAQPGAQATDYDQLDPHRHRRLLSSAPEAAAGSLNPHPQGIAVLCLLRMHHAVDSRA